MRVSSPIRSALARVAGSRLAEPVGRAVLIAAGLVGLSVIGRTTHAGAVDAALIAPSSASAPLALAFERPPAASAAFANTAPASASGPSAAVTAQVASAEDPVVLNTATADDLRRLPGVGAKRADAILALRARLGRLHAIEDLLKVKGIGRATLKRLRPLVRLDASPTGLLPRPDAGPLPPPASTPPPSEPHSPMG